MKMMKTMRTTMEMLTLLSSSLVVLVTMLTVAEGLERSASSVDFDCSFNASGRADLIIGIGSCNNPSKPQPSWQWMDDIDLFLFNGDVVYSHNITLAGLEEAFQLLATTPAYRVLETRTSSRFSCRSMKEGCTIHHGIWATWDDHDFGINDGGAGEPLPGWKDVQLAQRLHLFKSFMHPRCHGSSTPTLSERNGTYHSFDINDAVDGVGVRVTLLDTRTHKQLHAIPSLGTWSFVPILGKLAPITAAWTRLASAYLGWANTNPGALLGKHQWQWLEQNLCDPSAQHSVHLIVSSIQVLTSNPFVESWGHYPSELTALRNVLRKCNPKHVLLVSGDVHFTEFMSASDESGLMELTSSGMTHDCTAGGVPRFVCEWIVSQFGEHRSRRDRFLVTKSFAKLILHSSSKQQVAPTNTVTVKIVQSEDGTVVAQETVALLSGKLFADRMCGTNDKCLGVLRRDEPVSAVYVMSGLAVLILVCLVHIIMVLRCVLTSRGREVHEKRKGE
eukprot:m.53673 g.53673  ORF g.53673 m.53673 type:complete len:503 (+) comp12817_c0_seq1:3-1511(+)